MAWEKSLLILIPRTYTLKFLMDLAPCEFMYELPETWGQDFQFEMTLFIILGFPTYSNNVFFIMYNRKYTHSFVRNPQ